MKKRFSLKTVDPKIIISVCCILATLVFSIILGNILGDKAEKSRSEQSEGENNLSYQTSLPSPDKQGLRVPDLNAFSVDMTGAAEGVSLSTQTEAARDAGNALFVPLKDSEGDIIYTSDKTSALSVSANNNLTLSRLNQHFEYYTDYVCGYWISNFNPHNSSFDKINTQANDSTILAEAEDFGFDELLIRFSRTVSADTLIDYRVYLLNVKLACPDALVGISLSREFCESSDTASLISSLMDTADFLAIDMSSVSSPDELRSAISSLNYLLVRYPCRIIVSFGDEASFEATSTVLAELSVDSFIVLR